MSVLAGIAAPLALGLGIRGGLALWGAHNRANKINAYDDALNNQLQQQGAAPINFGTPKKFAWGNAKDSADQHQKLYDDAVKANNFNQQLGDYSNQGAQYGLGAFRNPESAKAILDPYNTQSAQYQVGGNYGRKQVVGGNYLHNLVANQNNPQQPSATPMAGLSPNPAPVDPNEPQLIEPNAPLQTGLSQTQLPPLPPIPDDAYIAPGDYYKALTNATAQQTADASTRNAETNAGGLSLRQKQYDTIQLPESGLKRQGQQLTNQANSIKNSKLSALLQSEINRNNRPPSSHPTASQDFDSTLAQGIKKGYWTPAEAIKARKIKLGLVARPIDDTTTTSGTGTGNDQLIPRGSTPAAGGIPGTKRKWQI